MSKKKSNRKKYSFSSQSKAWANAWAPIWEQDPEKSPRRNKDKKYKA